MALGVPLLQPMSPAPLPQATPTPSPIAVGLRAFRGPFLEAHGESGSSSNRAPSFKSYLFGRPAPQQLDPVDEDRSVPSSAEGENVGVPGRAGAESPSNPRQRVGQQTPSSDRSPHTRAGRDRQELSVAAPSSNGSTTGQQQREGRGQTDGIALREPYGKDGKVLGSSQGASKTASSSNVSSRLGLIPDEVIHGLEEPLRNSGSHQSSQVQGKPGSTAPSLRAATRASSEVDRLVFVGEWLSGGKSRGRVPPARSQAAAVQRPDLRQTASTAASDGKPQKADRPDQPPARPTHTRSSDSGRRTSQALSSASLQTAHGRLVDWTTGVKPVQVSETPGPVRGEVFPRPAPQASPKPSPPTPSNDPPRSQVSLQPSGHAHNEPGQDAGGLEIRFTEKTLSENTQSVTSHSPVPREPAQESPTFQSSESSDRDQLSQPSDQQAGSSSFRQVRSYSAVVTPAIPDVSPLTVAPPNDSSSFRGTLGVTLPLTQEPTSTLRERAQTSSFRAALGVAQPTVPDPVPTAPESNGQPPRQQEVPQLVPPSMNARQANLPRLSHFAAELSIESHPDGSNTDRLIGQGAKLESPSESSKLLGRETPAKVPQDPREETQVEFRRVAQVASSPSGNRFVTRRSSKPPQQVVSTRVATATRGNPNDSRAANPPIPRVPSTQQGNLDRGAAEADRSDIGEPGTRSPQETPSARVMGKTSGSENTTDLSTLSKPARSVVRTPPPTVETTAPVARSEVAAISHTPAEAKASFVLPSQSSAQNVDAGSARTEAYPEASSTASRVRSVERLVDMAALHRKIDSHQMNLLLSDNRIGRMSVRLVERGGVIDTLVRTDSTRASHLFTEGLPSLLESLAQRGLQVSNAGAGHFLGAREDAQPQQGGRYRPPRHPQRQNRRGGSDAGRVFRLEFE